LSNRIIKLFVGGNERAIFFDAQGEIKRIVKGAFVFDGDAVSVVKKRRNRCYDERNFLKFLNGEIGIKRVKSLKNLFLPNNVSEFCVN
jgi:hypothetical protein